MMVLAGAAGCTSQVGDFGEATDVPPRAATVPAYPAVHDVPPARDTKPLTPEERQRLADELSAARERQEAETADPVPARKPPAR
jgi:hypothetical protein